MADETEDRYAGQGGSYRRNPDSKERKLIERTETVEEAAAREAQEKEAARSERTRARAQAKADEDDAEDAKPVRKPSAAKE